MQNPGDSDLIWGHIVQMILRLFPIEKMHFQPTNTICDQALTRQIVFYSAMILVSLGDKLVPQ